VCQYFTIDKRTAIKWYIDNFNIKVEKINKDNPIKEKWEALPEITQEQKDYLLSRLINPELVEVKSLN
jgi:hypothetical protein